MCKKKIGERLATLRGERPFALVAAECGITENAYRNYERGDRIPSDDIKAKLAEYYHTTVDAIFFAD